MSAAAAARTDTATMGEFVSALAARVSVPTVLQNAAPPAGAGLRHGTLMPILEAVPAIAYVKEETLPSGQRLTQIRKRAPASLLAVVGGAGGRYVTDELRRGAGVKYDPRLAALFLDSCAASGADPGSV